MKTALSTSTPAGSVLVAIVALPPLTATGLPMSVAPTLNCTLPVAADGVTVAVRVTAVPANWGETGVADKVVVVVVTGLMSIVASPVESL